MGEDSLCAYQPGGGAVIEPLGAGLGTLAWAGQALQRLDRVPPFRRRMVRRRAEDYVRGQGREVVRPEDMEALARRRFGAAGPPALGRPGRHGHGA